MMHIARRGRAARVFFACSMIYTVGVRAVRVIGERPQAERVVTFVSRLVRRDAPEVVLTCVALWIYLVHRAAPQPLPLRPYVVNVNRPVTAPHRARVPGVEDRVVRVVGGVAKLPHEVDRFARARVTTIPIARVVRSCHRADQRAVDECGAVCAAEKLQRVQLESVAFAIHPPAEVAAEVHNDLLRGPLAAHRVEVDVDPFIGAALIGPLRALRAPGAALRDLLPLQHALGRQRVGAASAHGGPHPQQQAGLGSERTPVEQVRKREAVVRVGDISLYARLFRVNVFRHLLQCAPRNQLARRYYHRAHSVQAEKGGAVRGSGFRHVVLDFFEQPLARARARAATRARAYGDVEHARAEQALVVRSARHSERHRRGPTLAAAEVGGRGHRHRQLRRGLAGGAEEQGSHQPLDERGLDRLAHLFPLCRRVDRARKHHPNRAAQFLAPAARAAGGWQDAAAGSTRSARCGCT